MPSIPQPPIFPVAWCLKGPKRAFIQKVISNTPKNPNAIHDSQYERYGWIRDFGITESRICQVIDSLADFPESEEIITSLIRFARKVKANQVEIKKAIKKAEADIKAAEEKLAKLGFKVNKMESIEEVD